MPELSTDQLAARLVVIESISVASLGIMIAMAGPDPGKKRAVTTLDAIKVAAQRRLVEMRADPKEGETYLDDLLSEISENLGLLRPKDRQ